MPTFFLANHIGHGTKAKFIDEMERVITKRKKVSIKRDQAWYSENEMKQELGWSQLLVGRNRSMLLLKMIHPTNIENTFEQVHAC